MQPDGKAKSANRRLGRLWILCYHSICKEPGSIEDYCFLSAERFEAQMRGLERSRFDVLPLDAALKAQSAEGLERDAVAITFDDGYRNNLTVAGPILERFGFQATQFLTTGLIRNNHLLWPNRILFALQNTTVTSLHWRGREFALTNAKDRSVANATLQAAAKSLRPDAPDAVAEEIERALNCPVDPITLPNSDFAMVDAADIHAARQKGVFQFGAHTVSHPLLSALSNEALKVEIEGSVQSVGELNDGDCAGFAYPNGRTQDFDARAIAVLRSLNITHAVTTQEQPNTSTADVFRLGRLVVGSSDTWFKLRLKMWKLSGSAALNSLGFGRGAGHAEPPSRLS